MRACEVRSMNLGAAMAARMPRIRITTISSISVKPRVCFVIFVYLSDLTAYRLTLMPGLIIHKPCHESWSGREVFHAWGSDFPRSCQDPYTQNPAPADSALTCGQKL